MAKRGLDWNDKYSMFIVGPYQGARSYPKEKSLDGACLGIPHSAPPPSLGWGHPSAQERVEKGK